MTNLAILCCLDANDVCTGAGCLRALRERRGGFACYRGTGDGSFWPSCGAAIAAHPLRRMPECRRSWSVWCPSVHRRSTSACAPSPRGRSAPIWRPTPSGWRTTAFRSSGRPIKSFYQKRRNAKISAKTGPVDEMFISRAFVFIVKMGLTGYNRAIKKNKRQHPYKRCGAA